MAPRKPRTQKPKDNEDEAQGATGTTQGDAQTETADEQTDNEQDSQVEPAQPDERDGEIIRSYAGAYGGHVDVVQRGDGCFAIGRIGNQRVAFYPHENINTGSASRQIAAIVARRIARIEVENIDE